MRFGGLFFGSDKTYELDKENHDDIIYLNTHGYADIKMKPAAASSITLTSRQNGSDQTCFVIRLSAEKLWSEDLTAIWLDNYHSRGIIIFKMMANS